MKIATIQSEVTADVHKNGVLMRRLIKQAHENGADIIHFCEGALSGYAKQQLINPENINFTQIKLEIASIQNLARSYKIWVVFGCVHQLKDGQRPHNSMYIISDYGEIVNRYDKQKCSHSELSDWFTPGFSSCTFSVKNIKFTCILCIEVNFPDLFIEADNDNVQCILFSSYSKNDIFGIQCQGYAATHNYWISMSIPKNESKILPSQFIGPDGRIIKKCIRTRNSIIINEIDIDDKRWDIPLNKAKPWRKLAREGRIYLDNLDG